MYHSWVWPAASAEKKLWCLNHVGTCTQLFIARLVWRRFATAPDIAQLISIKISFSAWFVSGAYGLSTSIFWTEVCITQNSELSFIIALAVKSLVFASSFCLRPSGSFHPGNSSPPSLSSIPAVIVIIINAFLMRRVPLWLFICEAQSAVHETLQQYTT